MELKRAEARVQWNEKSKVRKMDKVRTIDSFLKMVVSQRWLEVNDLGRLVNRYGRRHLSWKFK